MTLTVKDVEDAVKKAAEEDQRKKFDPYRNAIVFLAGLLAFCVSLIIGIFSILPDHTKWEGSNLVAPMIGGILAWISLTTLAATIGMCIVQLLKASHFRTVNGHTAKTCETLVQVVMMGGPILLGSVAVYYCVRGGAALMDKSLMSGGKLPSFLTALCSLF